MSADDQIPPELANRIADAVEDIERNIEEKLVAAVGFRDVLAHTYGPIVNDDIVYDALQNEIDRYVQFVTAVDHYLSEVDKDQQ